MPALPRAPPAAVGFVCVSAKDGTLEWVSVANGSGAVVSVVGWTLTVDGRTQRLSGSLEPGDVRRMEVDFPLDAKGGDIALLNAAGELVDSFWYKVGADTTSAALRGLDSMRVLCALVDAPGVEVDNEWVCLLNAGTAQVDLAGWSLSDQKHEPFALSGVVKPGEALRIDNMYNEGTGVGVTLSNRRGQLQLLDANKKVVHAVSYKDSRASRIMEGVPVTFDVDFNVDAGGIELSKAPAIQTQPNVEQTERSLPILEKKESRFAGFYHVASIVLPTIAAMLALCKISKVLVRRSRS